MSESMRHFPWVDIETGVVAGLELPASPDNTIQERLARTHDGQRRLEVYEYLGKLSSQIQVNPLSPSNALGGKIAPPQNPLSLPDARHLGLDTYHVVLLAQDPEAPIVDKAGFDERLARLPETNLTNAMQRLLPAMKWSKHNLSVYFGLVEAASRDMDKSRMAAFFLGAYVSLYLDRGDRDIDPQLGALAFSSRRR